MSFEVDWMSEIRDAKNGATHRAWGEIFEGDAPEIIAEAARIKGVDPPDPDSEEYKLLIEEVVRQGQSERDELKRGYIEVGEN